MHKTVLQILAYLSVVVGLFTHIAFSYSHSGQYDNGIFYMLLAIAFVALASTHK